MDFILADIELTGTDSFSFYLSLAKYITLRGEIVAQLPILSKHLSKIILAMVLTIYSLRITTSLCLFKFFKVTQKRGCLDRAE
ncbi:MAG TPA: hypothetical protein VK184_08940 [Nostocaceae cyanobacterium]|nr:hypothetical protein [Nostocaceae cyanobacterium]